MRAVKAKNRTTPEKLTDPTVVGKMPMVRESRWVDIAFFCASNLRMNHFTA